MAPPITATARPPALVRLTRGWRAAAGVGVGAVIVLGVVVPVTVLGYWLLRGLAEQQALGSVWSRRSGRCLPPAAGTLAVLAAIPMCVLAVRYLSRSSALVERTSWVVYALPHITVGLAFLTLAARLGPPIYQSLALLVIAYVVLFLPQALGAGGGAPPIPTSLEEASRSLGRSWWSTLRRITVPLMSKGLIAGGALVFLTAMKELPATLLLRPTGSRRCRSASSRRPRRVSIPEPALPPSSCSWSRRCRSTCSPSGAPMAEGLFPARPELAPLAIRARGLVKRFGDTLALDGFSIDAWQGDLLGLLGPSGCGKTTALRVIAGFERPDDGTVDVGERTVVGPGIDVAPERRRVGMVFQDYALFPHMTAAANVAYGLDAGGERRKRVGEVSSWSGLPVWRRASPRVVRRATTACRSRQGTGPAPGGDPARRAVLQPGRFPARPGAA